MQASCQAAEMWSCDHGGVQLFTVVGCILQAVKHSFGVCHKFERPLSKDIPVQGLLQAKSVFKRDMKVGRRYFLVPHTCLTRDSQSLQSPSRSWIFQLYFLLLCCTWCREVRNPRPEISFVLFWLLIITILLNWKELLGFSWRTFSAICS